jgi:potassium/sodium efflux P-type ATPase|nr:cation-translocating P-type ATPase [Paenibacillus sp.]
MEVFGLKYNSEIASLIMQVLGQREGIYSVKPSSDTGRVLLTFDQQRISMDDISQTIYSIEEHWFSQHLVDSHPDSENAEPFQAAPVIKNDKTMVPQRIPLPLALSVAGLSFLGGKQLLVGRSALSRSTSAFMLSGAVSIIAGYPFLKRGFQQLSKDKKWNTDLILGTAALTLALVRENLVMLAGLSLLQYLDWKRRQTSGNEGNQTSQRSPLSMEMHTYSEKASKWGMILGGAAWTLTRDPLRGMAVLLAANPRTATASAEYAWNLAELKSKERGYMIPGRGSLSQLSRTQTILLEDTSQIFDEETQELRCVSHSVEETQLWCAAASLMKKSRHPWKKEVIRRADQTGRTLRTAFHVTEGDHGMKGRLQGAEIFIGSKTFIGQHHLDAGEYGLEAKRMQRAGFTVQFVFRRTNNNDTKCLGLIMGQPGEFNTEFKNMAMVCARNKWQIGVLHNSLDINSEKLAAHGVDDGWSHTREGQVIERIAALRSQGEEILLVTGNRSIYANDYLRNSDIPTMSMAQFGVIQPSLNYAVQIKQVVHQHFRVGRLWNTIGAILAIPLGIAAPVIGLVANALHLTFLTRSTQASDKPALAPIKAGPIHTAVQEVAAASEPVLWHSITSQEIMEQFQVDEHQGLGANQVTLIRNVYGMNQLQSKQPTPWIVSYIRQFKEFTTLVLLGAAGLAIVSGGLFDGLAMGAIVLANAAIGTVQERKAEKVVDALNQFQPSMCKVIRERQELNISSSELVPSDIVCLEAGDRVPADLRILRSWNLQVNEATLTGESLPIEKGHQVVEADCPLPERKNMLYMGASVTRGKAVGVVVTTGMRTEMGHVMSLMKQSEELEATPLQIKVTSITKRFLKGAAIAGGLMLVTGLLRGIPVAQMVMTSIALAASAVPEGLPVMITIALSAGIFRMAKKNAVIRKLSALETLGRTTVICSDKTGTLTKNEMTVKVIATVNRLWSVTGDGYNPDGTVVERMTDEVAVTTVLNKLKADEMNDSAAIQQIHHPDLEQLIRIGLLCNNSKLAEQEGRWEVQGDPTEGALLCLAAKTSLPGEDKTAWIRHHEIPFDSMAGKMAVVCQSSGRDQECYLYAKGSIEAILRDCEWYQENGEIYPLTDEQKQMILHQNEKLACDALRVLGFAYRRVKCNKNIEECIGNDLIYVGMVGMIDPPKPNVEQSIREARALGVKPVMITGDHPVTAIAIAKQLSIWDGNSQVLTGSEIELLSDKELADRVMHTSIFARVTPAHKLRIVTAYQNCGQIVAMTGDGVNDTPAIKKANVGIAMGQMGTEVTKEAADMILKEDHFGTIVDGVKEGRTIISNIRKAIGCLLTGNLAEILVTSASVIAGLPIPLVPIQILLMNLLTDALPAMILAVNPGNKTKQTKRQDIIDKRLYQKVVTRGVLLGIGSLGLFACSLAAGVPVAAAQTAAFTTLVAGQLIQTFSWRQEGNEETVRDWAKDRFFVTALGFSWLALLGCLYVPPIARVFHTVPLTFKQWVPILLVAGSVSKLSKPILKFLSGHKLASSVTTGQPALKVA